MSLAASIISSTLNAGTPLLIAAVGIIIHEKSGVLNLGIEGIMLMGAVSGFAVTHATGSFELGFLAGMGVGLLLGLLFAFFTIGLRANQYAAGLALTLFGTGLSAFLGQSLQGAALPGRAPLGIPGLEGIPFLGEAFFSQHWLAYCRACDDRRASGTSSSSLVPASFSEPSASLPNLHSRSAIPCASSASGPCSSVP